jgi:hypothetical protein
MAMPKLEEYLGDGLYAEYDGYQVALKANSREHPSDTVYLEPYTLERFVKFVEKINKAEHAESDDEPGE